MTRRTNEPAMPEVHPSGGPTDASESIRPPTRRATSATTPTLPSPGGSMLVPEPQGKVTRRARVASKPDHRAPGGSKQAPESTAEPTRPGGPSLRDRIREADTDRAVTDVDLARVLLDALCSSGQVDLLLPILTDEVRRLRRRRVAWIERQTFGGQAGGEPAEGGWLRLLPESFVLPDGRMVTWGTATVEDHEARVEWLNGQIHALVSDVDRHEQAVKLIREHGVTCLAEIEAAA
jgi:hypothetical protein